MHITQTLFGIDGAIAAVVGQSTIGTATAQLFEEAGARVELIPIGDGGMDLADEHAVAARLDKFVADHGQLDILVYAAIAVGSYPLTDTSLAQWDRLHGTNLRGAFLVLREGVRRMKSGGRIVAVSTMGSLHPVLHGNAGYGSSKAGLNGLIRAIAFDHAAQGIRANTVLHGAVPVGSFPDDMPPVSGPGMDPQRRLLGDGKVEDVAAAILYLVSPAGRFITGQTLTLDGGFLIS
jgi:NAD(P)-dependent dehydrogenase (short-subunit alcohol dehydrogenase family)